MKTEVCGAVGEAASSESITTRRRHGTVRANANDLWLWIPGSLASLGDGFEGELAGIGSFAQRCRSGSMITRGQGRGIYSTTSSHLGWDPHDCVGDRLRDIRCIYGQRMQQRPRSEGPATSEVLECRQSGHHRPEVPLQRIRCGMKIHEPQHGPFDAGTDLFVGLTCIFSDLIAAALSRKCFHVRGEFMRPRLAMQLNGKLVAIGQTGGSPQRRSCPSHLPRAGGATERFRRLFPRCQSSPLSSLAWINLTANPILAWLRKPDLLRPQRGKAPRSRLRTPRGSSPAPSGRHPRPRLRRRRSGSPWPRWTPACPG